MSYQYLFAVGAVPELSHAEFRSICTRRGLTFEDLRVQDTFLLCSSDQLFDLPDIVSELGGVLYAGERVATLGKDAVETIATYLHAQHQEGKIRFGLSGVRDAVGVQVKKRLTTLGHSARYVSISNMASIVHNNLVVRESHLTVHGGGVYVTRAVHDFESMAEFDEYRPAIDSKSGMLPPKLARMMINISGVSNDAVLLDPFCGSGTVLLEAVQLGYETLHGSDISEKAVADTNTNMQWLLSTRPGHIDWQIIQSDVRDLGAVYDRNSIDVIVTEPYMGAPKKGNERTDTIDREIEDLQALYYDMLGAFAEVLRDKGIVVFSKPRFLHQQAWRTIDWQHGLQEFGFDSISLLPQKDMVLYAREDQLVGREIWKLQKR